MDEDSSDGQEQPPGTQPCLHDEVKTALGLFDGAASTCQPSEGRPCPRCERDWPFESCFCCLFLDDKTWVAPEQGEISAAARTAKGRTAGDFPAP
eukprot:1235414-Lingulodinium_polyedra.AAC.1